jgi:nitrite reductase/ring-hydroxylating ferredoxin subunit
MDNDHRDGTRPVDDKGTGTSRRAILAGAGGVAVAAVLAGCATYGEGGGGGGSGGAGGGGAGAGAAGATATGSPGGSGGGAVLATTSDIPVGGGVIFKEQDVVITQPRAGTFKAFSATCTHAGCPVANVSGGTINCTCHGSKFKIEDGSVAKKPAPAPLAAKNIKVEGENITLA